MSILDDFLGDGASPVPSKRDLLGITEETLQRQRGVESGNRHRNPDGSLIRNPKSGALGVSQIMPATGVDPGFGIAPLRDQSEEEYKRFQKDYMTAMLARYGDERKALAAYNWGPGNFDKVADDPNWIARVPDETRKYVMKISGGVSEDVQSAVQATVEPKKSRQSLLDQPAPDLGDWNAPLSGGIDTAASRARAQMLRARHESRVRGMAEQMAAPTERDALLDDFLSVAPTTPKPEGEVSWGDYGRALQSGTAQFGQMAAGAGEWLGGKLDRISGEKGVLSLASEDARRWFGGLAQEYASMMSPEAQERISREILTLDPEKTIWQGPGEFLSSAALKFTQSAPSTLVPLLGFPILSRIGLGSIAGATYGVSEGILSLGGIQAQIADEIENATPDMLAKSERYQQLVKELGDPDAAREQLKQEATSIAPLVGGIAVGAVSALAGKYLEPIFVEGRRFGARVGGGFGSEAMQEFGQSGAEQLAQNYAAQIYDSSRKLSEGVLEQSLQGALIGGPMGGAVAGLLGKGPEPEAPAPVETPPPPTDADTIAGLPPRSAYRATPAAPYTETNPDYLAEFDPKADYMPPELPAAPKKYGSGKYANLRPGEQAAADEAAGLTFEKTLKEQQKGFAGVPDYTARTEDQLEFTPTFAPGEAAQQPLALPPPGGESLDTAKSINRPLPPAPEQQQGLDLLDWGGLGTDNERPAVAPDTSIPEGYNQRLDQPDLFDAPPAPPAPPAPALMGQGPVVGGGVPGPGIRRPIPAPSIQTGAAGAALSPGASGVSILAPVTSRTQEQVGREAVRYTPDGQVVERVPVKNRRHERRLLQQWETQYPDSLVRVVPVMKATTNTRLIPSGQTAPDAPSAEPITDLRAQVASMQRGERQGVYLSADNVARLKKTGQYIALTNGVTPLENFDGKGGVMLFRDRAAAEEGIQMARTAGTPQEVIGALTGAGLGKPLDSDIVVQRLDEDGAVVQERLVADAEEAKQVQAEWGENSRVVSAKFAIRRRNQLIAREERMLAEEKTETVGRKLRKAARRREGEKRRGVGPLFAPRDVIFGEDVPGGIYTTYEEVFNEAQTAELKMREASTVSDRLKARAELNNAIERGQALLALHPHRTQAAARAEQASKGAKKESATLARREEDPDRARSLAEESRQERAQRRVEADAETSLRRWAGASAWLKVQELSPKNRALFEALWNLMNPQSPTSKASGEVEYAGKKVAQSELVRRAREAMIQYITDYRLALNTLRRTTADGEQRQKLNKVYDELGKISETLTKLGASALTETSVPRAAFTATYRLLRHINLAGEYGVAAEINRDYVLNTLGRDTKSLLSALQEVTANRDRPEPTYTEGDLKNMDEADLNRAYLRALGRVNTRISNGARAQMVEAIATAENWFERPGAGTPQPESASAKAKAMRLKDLQAKVRGGKHLTYYDLVRHFKEVTGATRIPKPAPMDAYLADKPRSEKIKLILRMQAKDEQAEWGVNRRTQMAGLTRSANAAKEEKLLTDDDLKALTEPQTAEDKALPKAQWEKKALGKVREEYKRVVGREPKSTSTVKGMWAAIKRAARTPGLATTRSRYNTKALYDRTIPRDVMEGSDKVKKEHAKRHADAVKALSLISAKVKTILDSDKSWSEKGKPIENSTAAKLWLKWLTQYADMHLNIKGQSLGAIKEMEKLAEDLARAFELKPVERVKYLSNLYAAEAREQVLGAAKSDPTVLGDLRNPTVRAKWNFYSAERTRKAIVLMRRMSAMFDKEYIRRRKAEMDPEAAEKDADLQEKSWTDSVYWHNYIGPVLSKYAESLMGDSMTGYALYQPSAEQRRMIDWIMADWRKDPRYAPIDKLLQSFGYYDKIETKWNPKTRKHEIVGEPTVAAQRRYRKRQGVAGEKDRGLTGVEVNIPGYTGTVDTTRAASTTQTEPKDNPRLMNALVTAWDINNAVGKFVAVVQRPFSSKQDIIDAEQELIAELQVISNERPVDVGEQRVPIFKRTSPVGIFKLTYPHNMSEVSFRTFGPRLAEGKLKVTEVRQAVKDLWKKVELSDDVKEQAKKRGEAKQRTLTPRQARDLEARRTSPENIAALQRLGKDDDLALDITDFTSRYQQASAPEWDGSDAVQGVLTANGGYSTYREVLGALANKLGQGHAYAPLLKKLLSLQAHHGTIIKVDNDLDKVGTFGVDDEGQPTIRINLAALGGDPVQLIHTVLHEAVHAATVGQLVGSPLFGSRLMLQAMDQLRLAAKEKLQLTGDTAYGLTNAFEFVAEAFTNPQLQAELKKVKLADVNQTLWQKFVSLVRQILGMEPQGETLLDAVISVESGLFGEGVADKRVIRVVKALTRQNLDRSTMNAVRDYTARLANDYDAAARVMEKLEATSDRASEWGQDFVLAAQTMRQVLKRYAPMFVNAEGENVMRKYGAAFFARVADSQRMLMGDASGKLEDGSWSPAALSNMWSDIKAKSAAQYRLVSEVMTKATQFRMFPDKPLTDEAHAHLPDTAKIREEHAKLQELWNQLAPATKTLYKAVESYYRNTIKTESHLMALTAIRTYMADHKEWAGRFNYTEKDIEEKQLNTKDGLRREFGDALDDAAIALILKMANVPAMYEGPYFPLKRYGDFVVTAKRKLETVTFADKKERAEWAKVKEAEDPTHELEYSDEDGVPSITVYEVEARFAETRTEANKNKAEMKAKYGDDASDVLLKSKLYEAQAAIPSGAALNTLLGKLKDNAAAQNAIKDFYLRSLHDASFRKNQIRRKNTGGVDPLIQHRAFADYAKSASYYVAQLRFGHKMATALAEMAQIARNYKDNEYGTAVKAGQVVKELQTRDKMAASPYEVGKWVRRGVEFSQFMMLTSPSYWMINASQPYIITLPWLAAQAKGGVQEATAALANAQSLIAHPILKETINSIGGLRAFFDRRSAESAYSVLQQVEQQIRARAGAKADEYIEMLETLKRESIIDMSMQSEIRDIASGEDTGFWSRLMDASRVMAHVTEVNNRIMTAIAAYDVARGRNAPAVNAIEFARKAVAETQYDYSAANKARLFSAQAGWWRPLIFQFMQYTQHTYALMVDAWQAAFKGASPEERAMGRKILGGIFLQHMLVGGITAATIQPVKWAFGLMLMALPGGDEEDETLRRVLSGQTYDRFWREVLVEMTNKPVGEALSAGVLTRPLGVDVSSRMTLGQLYFIDLNPESAETMLGSAAMSFGGPLVNIAGNHVRAAKYLADGEISKAVELTTPKMVRDFIRMTRYASDGLTDSTGKVILDNEDISPVALAAQSLGFSPAAISETYARNQAVKDLQRYVNDQKADILKAYRNADTPAERRAVAKRMRELNRKYRLGMTYGDLVRSRMGKLEREKAIQKYGATLSPRERRYADEGDPYNVPEE